MPSSVTHTYFAEEVFESLPLVYQKKLKGQKEYFKLFAQGSDPFMFYHFFIGKKAIEGKKIQHQLHTTKTRDFFCSIISYIQKNHVENQGEIMAYLYGYICHYYLDLTIHPFIHYQAGKFDRKDKSTYSSNTLHQKIEYRIDSYIIQEKLKKNPKRFKSYQYIFQVSKFSDSLEQIIDNVMEENYSIQNSSKIYLKSIWCMKKFWRYANYDPIGYKAFLYKIIDKLSPKYVTRLEELSFHTAITGEEYLNLEKESWCYPWDNSTYFQDSFFDLFQLAKDNARKAIIKVTDIIEKGVLDSTQCDQLFQNLSYSTGLPCEENVEYRYFKESEAIIHPLAKKDYQNAFKIYQKCFHREFQKRNYFCFNKIIGLYKNNKLIGVCQIDFIKNSFENQKIAYLNSFCIDPTYQNKGYGNQFLKSIILYCKRNNVDKINLTSNKNRTYAHRLYLKNQFQKIDTTVFSRNI